MRLCLLRSMLFTMDFSSSDNWAMVCLRLESSRVLIFSSSVSFLIFSLSFFSSSSRDFISSDFS